MPVILEIVALFLVVAFLLLSRSKDGSKAAISLVQILGMFVIGLGIVGISVILYNRFEDRPVLMQSLDGIELGMSEVDVTLLKGEPVSRTPLKTTDNEQYRELATYGAHSTTSLFVYFGGMKGALHVDSVCMQEDTFSIFGLGQFSSEQDVLDKLGTPSGTSINAKGTRKLLTFDSWHVAYEIQQGKVITMCVTNKAKMAYDVEYQNATN